MIRVVLAVMFLFVVSPSARAQDVPTPEAAPADAPLNDDELEALLQDRVVTTASRSGESANTAPASVYTIPGDDLERYGIRTVDEALAYLGLGVFVSNSGGDYVSSVDLGVHGVLFRDDNVHVLMLVDGHVMNNQATGTVRFDAALGIPNAAIDHVEVMLGPGSVSFGTNAMLAVVQIFTRGGAALGGAHFEVDENLSLPVGPGDRIASARGADRVGSRTRIGASYGQPLRVGDHEGEIAIYAELTQERSESIRVRPQTGEYLEYTAAEGAWGTTPARPRLLTPNGYVRASIGRVRFSLQAGAMHRTLPYSGTWNDPDTGDDGRTLRVDVSHDADPSARLHVRSRLYGDYVWQRGSDAWIHDYWCVPGTPQGCRVTGTSRSLSAGAEQVFAVDWTTDARFVTQLGYDLRVRNANGEPSTYTNRISGAPATSVPVVRYELSSFLGAVFVQQVINAGEYASVNVGARLDIDSLFGARLSPRLSFVATPTSRATLRASYSEAFRGPSADELRYTDLVYVLPPDSLDAEVARFADLEWTQRFARGRLSLRGFGALYTRLVDDDLVPDDEVLAAIADGRLSPSAELGLIVTPINYGRIVSVGGTAMMNVSPVDRLELASGVTCSTTYIVDDGDRTREPAVLPHMHGNARVAYRFDAGDTSIALASQFSSRRIGLTLPGNGADVQANVGGLFDLRFTTSGRIGTTSGLRYRAGFHYAHNGRSTNLLAPGPRPDDAMGNPDPYASESIVAAQLSRMFFFVGLRYDVPVARPPE